MTTNNGQNETETRTIEKGVFERVKIRRGSKTEVHTEIIKKNPKKVVLAEFGEFQLYVYPWDFPNMVFFSGNLRLFAKSFEHSSVSEQIRKTDIPNLRRLTNMADWYLKGFWKKYSSKRPKELKSLREAIVRAYNEGLSEQKKLESSPDFTN